MGRYGNRKFSRARVLLLLLKLILGWAQRLIVRELVLLETSRMDVVDEFWRKKKCRTFHLILLSPDWFPINADLLCFSSCRQEQKVNWNYQQSFLNFSKDWSDEKAKRIQLLLVLGKEQKWLNSESAALDNRQKFINRIEENYQTQRSWSMDLNSKHWRACSLMKK